MQWQLQTESPWTHVTTLSHNQQLLLVLPLCAEMGAVLCAVEVDSDTATAAWSKTLRNNLTNSLAIGIKELHCDVGDINYAVDENLKIFWPQNTLHMQAEALYQQQFLWHREALADFQCAARIVLRLLLFLFRHLCLTISVLRRWVCLSCSRCQWAVRRDVYRQSAALGAHWNSSPLLCSASPHLGSASDVPLWAGTPAGWRRTLPAADQTLILVAGETCV